MSSCCSQSSSLFGLELGIVRVPVAGIAFRMHKSLHAGDDRDFEGLAALP